MAKEHPEHEPRDVGTGERLAHLASAMGNATAHKMQGETQTEEGARQQVDAASLESLLASWPEAPRKGARQMRPAAVITQLAFLAATRRERADNRATRC